jgi:hypothetical protein
MITLGMAAATLAGCVMTAAPARAGLLDGIGRLEPYVPLPWIRPESSQWQLFGPEFYGRMAVARNADGRLEIFAIGSGSVSFRWQWVPGTDNWSDWSTLHAPPAGAYGSPAVILDSAGCLNLFVRGGDGNIWQRRQRFRPGEPGGWTEWRSLGGEVTGDPAVGQKADGTLVVLARGGDGSPKELEQWGPGTDRWRPGWSDLLTPGPRMVSEIAAARNVHGKLQVFMRLQDDTLYTKLLGDQPYTWSNWQYLGGRVQGNPVVGQNADGRLELFIRGEGGDLQHAWETGQPYRWTSLSALGGVLDSDPAVGRNFDGRLEVFGIGTDQALYHRSQLLAVPNSLWSEWDCLFGWWAGQPSVNLNGSYALEVFVRGTDRMTYHRRQIGPGLWR